jgi:hypothetical protein
MTPDRARLKSDQQEIQRTLKRNQDALQTVRRKTERYSRALTSSGAEIRDAKRDLRKAGYLK